MATYTPEQIKKLSDAQLKTYVESRNPWKGVVDPLGGVGGFGYSPNLANLQIGGANSEARKNWRTRAEDVAQWDRNKWNQWNNAREAGRAGGGGFFSGALETAKTPFEAGGVFAPPRDAVEAAIKIGGAMYGANALGLGAPGSLPFTSAGAGSFSAPGSAAYNEALATTVGGNTALAPELLSANEIAALAGNPAAFQAAQTAGTIPAGMTMNTAGQVLTSAGVPLVGASLGGGGLLNTVLNAGKDVASTVTGATNAVTGAGGISTNPTLTDVLTGLVPAGLGYLGSDAAAEAQDRATQAQKELAARYEAMGAPYRQRLSDLYSNPDAYLTSKEVQTPVQQGTDILARSLSTGGNPVASGRALQQLQSYSADQLFGRLGEEKSRLANFGGLSSYQGASPQIAQSANVANPWDIQKWNALGVGAESLSNIFNPPKRSAFNELTMKRDPNDVIEASQLDWEKILRPNNRANQYLRNIDWNK